MLYIVSLVKYDSKVTTYQLGDDPAVKEDQKYTLFLCLGLKVLANVQAS